MAARFRDLALSLEMKAGDLAAAGPQFAEWRYHLLLDAQRARDFAAELVKDEPPQPTIEELTGSMPNLTGGLSTEEFMRQIRSG